MSSLLRILRTPSRTTCLLSCNITTPILCRYSSTSEQGAPPLLARLRTDLKSALKSKDKARLNVLRSLLADITNSEKTSSPIKDETALLIQLRKRINAAKEASKQAQEVSRPDLVEKEKEQLDVLEQYAGNIKTMPEDEIRSVVEAIVAELKKDVQPVSAGNILKKAFGPGGKFDGRIVEKGIVARIAKELSK